MSTYLPEPTGRATYRFLEAADDELHPDRRDDLACRLSLALEDFPELAGETVTVAKLHPENEYIRGKPIAAADPYNRLVYVRPEERTTNMTLYHELAHLAIRVEHEQGADVPVTSEPFCSIYATARIPHSRIDTERIAYLGYPDVDPDEWPGLCQRALEYRENNRNYIQKAKEWLAV